MSGTNSQHTSSKLRNKSLEIIKKMGRPMAASEIEIWLRIHEPELWQDIAGKCEDYVRIILSLTRSSVLLKYRPLKPIQGIDKRSTFFGLTSEKYDSAQWETFTPKSTHAKSLMKKHQNKSKEHKKKIIQKDIDRVNTIFDGLGDDDTFFGAWFSDPMQGLQTK